MQVLCILLTLLASAIIIANAMGLSISVSFIPKRYAKTTPHRKKIC